MKRTAFFLTLIFVSFSLASIAQGVTIGSNNPPDSSAVLELQDTAKGFLMTRLTTTQRNAIQNPATGLQIYNTTTNCLQIYMPQSGWRDVVCDCPPNTPSSTFTFNDSVAFNSNAIFNAATPGMTYSWTFQNGNPSTSSQQSDTVTWANAGTYTVSLTVTDNNSCNTTTTDSIVILPCVSGSSITFTNCGASGRFGPTQNQCNTTYGNNVVTSINGIQRWIVPVGICNITIEAYGAQGGISGYSSTPGGLGGYCKGSFSIMGGDTLFVLVGQQGMPGNGGGNWWAAGGGGGTFVAIGTSIQAATPLIVAGGGGGSHDWNQPYSAGGAGGVILTIGGNGNAGTGSGNGGSAGSGYHGNASEGSLAFINGGLGANGTSYCTGCASGGFGGGGEAGGNPGGGGGGYVGGNYGSSSQQSGNGYNRGGMGGTSFNGGTNQTNTAGVRQGNGQVIITW